MYVLMPVLMCTWLHVCLYKIFNAYSVRKVFRLLKMLPAVSQRRACGSTGCQPHGRSTQLVYYRTPARTSARCYPRNTWWRCVCTEEQITAAGIGSLSPCDSSWSMKFTIKKDGRMLSCWLISLTTTCWAWKPRRGHKAPLWVCAGGLWREPGDHVGPLGPSLWAHASLWPLVAVNCAALLPHFLLLWCPCLRPAGHGLNPLKPGVKINLPPFNLWYQAPCPSNWKADWCGCHSMHLFTGPKNIDHF